MVINGMPDFWVRQGWAAGDKRLCNKSSNVLKKGIRICEVPISYNGRKWHDAFQARWALLIYRLVN
jgi:hypothetical protein